MLKENFGKILLSAVVCVIVVSFSIIFYTLFSLGENMDMFIVWLIFAAEGLKNVLSGGWNSSFAFIGTVMLIIWFIYTMIRVLSSKYNEIKFEDSTVELSWDEKKEQIFKQYNGLFWKIGLTFWVLSLMMDFVAVGIPTAKQAAVIYIVPKMINNVDMQEIPPNLLKLVNEGLKEMIVSVKGEVGKVAKGVANNATQAAKNTAKEVLGVVVEKDVEKDKEESNNK